MDDSNVIELIQLREKTEAEIIEYQREIQTIKKVIEMKQGTVDLLNNIILKHTQEQK